MKVILLLSIASIGFNSCKQRTQSVKIEENEIAFERGDEFYRLSCASCHGHKNRILYHPSLIEMIGMNKDTLMQKTKILENDSLHKAVVGLSPKQIDTLRIFLKSYSGVSY